MPRSRTTIKSDDKEYWEGKLDEFYTLTREATPPSTLLSKKDRQFLTRKNGMATAGLLKNDKESMRMLIEQAMLALEVAGFDIKERNWLEDCLQKSAPKGSRGEPAVPIIDKLMIHYFYPRMTGCEIAKEVSDIEEFRSQLYTEWSPDALTHMPESSNVELSEELTQHQLKESYKSSLSSHLIDVDVVHHLNTIQAKKLLRELFGIKENTLRKILKEK